MVKELKVGDWVKFEDSRQYIYWICDCNNLCVLNNQHSTSCDFCGMERPPLPGEKDADEGGKVSGNEANH